MIQLKNVSKFYYSKGIIASGFSKVNLELQTGEFVIVTGESGSGKSTLLNVISGLDSYEEGEMYIDGKETSHYTTEDFEDYRKKYIGNIFQNFNLINSYTVYENIELALLINGHKKSEVKEKIKDIIAKVGLTEFAKTKASKLSGGQKQRVSIARALAKETSIIVADEPTGNLDSKSAEDIVTLLSNIAKEKLVIIVTHNLEQFQDKATRIIRMHDGKIVEDKKNKEEKNVEKPIQEGSYRDIFLRSKIRLGVRNTFNLVQKFILLLVVFLFLSLSITAVYVSYQQRGESFDEFMYNEFFMNASQERIVIKKGDNSLFTAEDDEKIKSIKNVASVEKNDILLDSMISLESKDGATYFDGFASSASKLKKVDVGALPKEDNEVVIEMAEQEKDFYPVEEILNASYTLYMSRNVGEEDKGDETIKVVGIIYKNGYNLGNMYVSENKLVASTQGIYEQNSNISMAINDKIYKENECPFTIVSSTKVPTGKVYVPEEMNLNYANGNSLYKKIGITAKNIYFEKTLNLEINKIYTKENYKALTGYENYDEFPSAVFVSPTDYKSLFQSGNYQYSVFANNKDNVEKVAKDLEKNGYKAMAIKDTVLENEAEAILNIVQVPLTILFVLAIFFIVYFVTKLILKSRAAYFAILRILGMSRKNVKRILDVEMLLLINIAYGIFLALVQLVKEGVIQIPYLVKMLGFLEVRDMAILYLTLVVMAYLISGKFAKSIFKRSAMGTYREEV